MRRDPAQVSSAVRQQHAVDHLPVALLAVQFAWVGGRGCARAVHGADAVAVGADLDVGHFGSTAHRYPQAEYPAKSTHESLCVGLVASRAIFISAIMIATSCGSIGPVRIAW
jgi:hypothetical protein